MDNLETLGTPEKIRGSLLSPPDRVDLEAIALKFVARAGGIDAIVEMLYAEYVGATDGSPVRARIMEMIMKSFTKLHDRQSAPDDLKDLTDADLEKQLLQQLQRLGVTNGNPGHAPEAGTPQAAGSP